MYVKYVSSFQNISSLNVFFTSVPFFLNFFFNCLALNHIGMLAEIAGCGTALLRKNSTSYLCITPLCFPCSVVSCCYTVAALVPCFVVGNCSVFPGSAVFITLLVCFL